MSTDDDLDKWASWLLHRRDGDDGAQYEKALEYLVPIRERVLDNAHVNDGDTVLDVGAGDGLIAFGALERVGSTGQVIASDLSADLVDRLRELTIEAGVADRVSVVRARAEDLGEIPDASVDVVTTRAVLIYVADKASAFKEFFRVLRPGGRASLHEPINSYFPLTLDEFWGFDARPVSDLVEKVFEYEGWTRAEIGEDPMLNFSTKDLLLHAEDAGFGEIRIDLTVRVQPGTWVVDWERMLDTSPNPDAHTVGEALRGALTEKEAARFEQHLRPLVDAGEGTIRSADAFVTAVKPQSSIDSPLGARVRA